jgi:hypothetical protein
MRQSELTPSLTLPRWEREQNSSPMGLGTEPSPIGGGQGGGDAVNYNLIVRMY